MKYLLPANSMVIFGLTALPRKTNVRTRTTCDVIIEDFFDGTGLYKTFDSYWLFGGTNNGNSMSISAHDYVLYFRAKNLIKL